MKFNLIPSNNCYLLYLFQRIIGLEWKEIYAQITSLRQVLGQNIKRWTLLSQDKAQMSSISTWVFWNALQFLVPDMNAKPSKDTLKSSVETVLSDANDLQEPSTNLPTCTKRKLQRGISDQQQLLMNECIRVLKQPDQPDQDTSFWSVRCWKASRVWPPNKNYCWKKDFRHLVWAWAWAAIWWWL